jgi:hypothetical protein
VLATDLNALLRVPGRIVLSPTDLTQPFPYGGVSLGLVRDVVALPGKRVSRVREETMGVVVMGGVDLGEAWSIAAVVRAIEQGQAGTFYRTEAGGASGEQGIVSNPLTNAPGTWISASRVLFAPLDELQQFFLYLPAAIAFPDEAARIRHAIGEEAGDPVVWWATPRPSDGLAALRKKKEDLVL